MLLDGERVAGLVPWYYLVSAAHAELQAQRADPAQRGGAKGPPCQPSVEPPAQESMLPVRVARIVNTRLSASG